MYRPHYAVIELFSEELIGCYHSKKEAMQAIEEAGSLEDYQLFELVSFLYEFLPVQLLQLLKICRSPENFVIPMTKSHRNLIS